jgi:hypothetical protein
MLCLCIALPVIYPSAPVILLGHTYSSSLGLFSSFRELGSELFCSVMNSAGSTTKTFVVDTKIGATPRYVTMTCLQDPRDERVHTTVYMSSSFSSRPKWLIQTSRCSM